MIGRGVLLECLDSQLIEAVLVINRKSIEMEHEKLTEVLVKDFADLSAMKDQWFNYDALFCCMGVSAVGMDEELYYHITYTLTVDMAKAYHEQRPDGVLTYISGAGTRSSETGGQNWARVKGKTENALLDIGFKAAYMMRPGFILPQRGIKSRTGWYNTMYAIFTPLYYVLRIFPGAVTNTTATGKCMIQLVTHGSEHTILNNKEINLEAKALDAAY